MTHHTCRFAGKDHPRLLRTHDTDCPDTDTCGGCLPRPAADGLQVCQTCEERARKALRDLPALWDDVQDAGVLKGASRGKGAGGTPLPIDPDAADWRTRVRACLVGWCLVLEEDFDATLDGATDTVAWMADKVGIYAGRILADVQHADQLVADLCGWVEDDGTRHVGLVTEGRRLEGKGASHGIRLLCACGERVPVVTDADGRPDEEAILTCRGCGAWGVLSWWREQLATGDLPAMTISGLVRWLAQQGHRTTEKALRVKADRGLIAAVGTQADGVGRPARTFDPVAVMGVVVARRASA